MPFLLTRPAEARSPEVEVLPDQRKRYTRFFRLTQTGEIPYGINTLPGTLDPWPETAPPGFGGCRLTYKKISDNTPINLHGGKDIEPWVELIYEQIDQNNRTIIGNADISFDQYGRKTVVEKYVQFSNGTTVYNDIVGVSIAPVAGPVCVLKEYEKPNDGTLIEWKLTYIDSGVLSDNEELRFGGKIIVRKITALNEIPATPAGFTLVTTSTEYVEGLPVYTYGFTRANNGTGTGTGGEISRGFTNSQGGDVAFNPLTPNLATGDVICTIRYVSDPSITTNPITQPTGFVLFAVDVSDDAGFRMWETRSGFGGGLAIEVDVAGEPDGALVYTVRQNDDTATTPAYPGSGTAYLVRLDHTRDNGFFRNTATYKKPPASVTYKKKIGFEKPGSAVIGGSPIQYSKTSPVTMEILADHEVTYGATQITDVPFTVSNYATLYASWTPVATGVTESVSQALGGYLAGASGTSGTGIFNGVDCTSWSYQLGSSTPSSFSAAVHVLDVNNDPYLTDITGVVVFRRIKVSYDFS